MTTDIIIINRNLRILDNAALYYGSLRSNYIVVYLYDENYWKANGKSSRQLKFSNDCLKELNEDLREVNSKINIFEGDFVDLKNWIHANYKDYFIHMNHTNLMLDPSSELTKLVVNKGFNITRLGLKLSL